MLGSGQYRLELRARGGGSVLGVLAWDRITWTRELDEVSRANGESPATRSHHRELLGSVRPWAHEIAVVRDGEDVWEGPVQPGTRWDRDRLRWRASDLSAWLEHRRQVSDSSYEMVPAAHIFAAYVQTTLAIAPTGMTLDVGRPGPAATRVVEASEGRRVADLTRELGRDVVDWTVVGRRMYVGGESLDVPTLPTLRDATCEVEDCEALEVATEVAVVGRQREGMQPPISGVVGGDDETYGLLSAIVREPHVDDEGTARSAAASRLALLEPDGLFLRLSLSPRAPVTMASLIPGALVGVEVVDHLRPISGTWRVTTVRVEVDVTDGERVEVDLWPPGTT